MTATAWEFWRISEKDGGMAQWLGATRRSPKGMFEPGAVWTLVPARLTFLPNWFVSEDHQRAADEATWVHDWVEVSEARTLAAELRDPATEELRRLNSPSAPEQFGRLPRFDIEPLLGIRAANALAARLN